MLKQLPEQLARARELMRQAKFEEALNIVRNLEYMDSLPKEDLLSTLLTKSAIYGALGQYDKRLEISELAYQLSEDLGLVPESIEALIGKAIIAFIGDIDKASLYVKEAERRLKSLEDSTSAWMLRRDLLVIKSWIQFLKGNPNRAERPAQKCLELTKAQKFDNKLDLAATYNLLGYINTYQGNETKALEYAIESLKLNKELNHTIAIGSNYALIARIYLFKGDYDQSLQYCKQSESIKEFNENTRLDVLSILAQIYYFKGNLNRALKYQQQTVALAEQIKNTNHLVMDLVYLGFFYRMAGKNDLVIESFERCLTLSEKWGYWGYMVISLSNLIFINVDEGSRKIANRYFTRLSDLKDQKEQNKPLISFWYSISKAYIMKTSTRMRDHVEAQRMFKELIDGITQRGVFPDLLMFLLGNFCDLLLEELSIYKDLEILDEILPLITKCLDRAEEEHNYYWLAEGKLLQGKLALIRMNFEEARKLLVEAQHIAELHGLDLLAWGISSEHDELLKQIDIWDKNERDKASMSERIKLASTSTVLERIERKRAVEPPEIADETPILLLIMDSSGATYFNHPFVEDWDYSDLFSSFMSAFNAFMDEIFSKSIDRIRVGENTILINPVESFLVCYVIKGQSYLALQKLSRFSETIRENPKIWQALNKSIKTNEMLELDKPPVLKTVIDEIF